TLITAIPEMADDDAPGRHSLVREQGQLFQRQLAEMGGVGHDRAAGPPVRPRGGPKDTLLARRDVAALRADLADEPGADARAVHPGRELLHELIGQVVGGAGIDLGRVDSLAVPAGAHHDLDAARLADPPQRERVAAQADVRWVADRAPARGA